MFLYLYCLVFRWFVIINDENLELRCVTRKDDTEMYALFYRHYCPKQRDSYVHKIINTVL